jgi:Leucine-rich repeat (LRR) protein
LYRESTTKFINNFKFLLIESIKFYQIHYPTTTEPPTTEEPPPTLAPDQCPPLEVYSPCKCFDNAYDDGALLLDCDYTAMNDQRISEILNAFLSDQTINPLRALRVENNQLTKIPDEIKLLPELQELYLYNNDIQIITADSLTFNAPEKIIGLGLSVTTVEPGAFAGLLLKDS